MKCFSSFVADHFSDAPIWDRSSLVISSRDLSKAELSLLKLLPWPIGELSLSYATYQAGLDEDKHIAEIAEMFSLRRGAFRRYSVFHLLLWLPHFQCIWCQNCRDLLLLWKQRNISFKGCLKVSLSAELGKEPSVCITPEPLLADSLKAFFKVQDLCKTGMAKKKVFGVGKEDVSLQQPRGTLQIKGSFSQQCILLHLQLFCLLWNEIT